MTQEFIANYINKKLEENEYYIKYTFYELRIKNNLSEQEVDYFLDINKNYFENKGYLVYFTNEIYSYCGEKKVVENNELFVAIKEAKS